MWWQQLTYVINLNKLIIDTDYEIDNLVRFTESSVLNFTTWLFSRFYKKFN